MRKRLVLLLVALAAGCAETPPTPEPVAETPVEAPVVEEAPKFSNSTLKYLANRKLEPQPTRPLNVKTRCSNRDAIGTATKLDLWVKQAEVKRFNALVNMKGRGTCRFDLGEFEQVEKLPQALLRHKKQDGCLVRMWEQGPKVTVAFNGCPRSCEGEAFDYLWPIMVEAKTGRCF